MTSQVSFEKLTSHKSWTMKDGIKVRDLAMIGVALPKFGIDDIMMMPQASFEKPTSHESWL